MTIPSRFFPFAGAALIATGAACSSVPIEKPPTANHAACEGTTRANTHEALLRPQEIVSVTALKDKPFIARPSALKVAAAESRAKLQGARVVLRPRAGLTAEWLQLMANCDRAIVAEAPLSSSGPACPLELDQSRTTVRSTGDGFALDIVSDDPRVASEILERAQSLASATK